jgi:uncharacterized protein
MIAVDTNILLYSHREDYPLHEQAFNAISKLSETRELWAIPWPCIHEFVAISTNPRLFPDPSSLRDVEKQLAQWQSSPTLRLLGETDMHAETLLEVLARSHVVGGAVYDARIAAVCIENGVRELWTADRDFAKFKGLKSSNPLVS